MSALPSLRTLNAVLAAAAGDTAEAAQRLGLAYVDLFAALVAAGKRPKRTNRLRPMQYAEAVRRFPHDRAAAAAFVGVSTLQFGDSCRRYAASRARPDPRRPGAPGWR